MSVAARLRGEARDLLELVLVPGLAAVLPWRLCFAAFRLLSRWRFLYREACDAALEQAQARGHVRDAAAWQRTRRLVTLVDHADYYLAVTRTDRYLRRHLVKHGEWPAPGAAAVLFTFHWGAGMWGLRHIAARGLQAHALVAAHRPELFPGRRVRYWYYGRRNLAVARALGCPPLDVSRSMRPVIKALRGDGQIVAAVDVPSDQVAASESIDFIGRRARVPRGLLRLAVDAGVPVTVFLTGIRLRDGKRTLRIHQLGRYGDLETLIADVFALLERAIESEPAAWQFWEVAPRFFEEPAAV
jgi:hypothetical protein